MIFNIGRVNLGIHTSIERDGLSLLIYMKVHIEVQFILDSLGTKTE